jgi:hypothetical protein
MHSRKMEGILDAGLRFADAAQTAECTCLTQSSSMLAAELFMQVLKQLRASGGEGLRRKGTFQGSFASSSRAD